MTNDFSIAWMFFSWSGRLGRLRYFIGILLVAVLSAVTSETMSKSAFSLITSLLLLYVGLALEAKRLHDIGLGALWIVWLNLLFFAWGIGTAVFLIPWSGVHHIAAETFMKSAIFWLIVGCVLPVAGKAAWLIFFPGSEGANPFGPAAPESEPTPTRRMVRSIAPMAPASAAPLIQRSAVRGRSGFGRRGR